MDSTLGDHLIHTHIEGYLLLYPNLRECEGWGEGEGVIGRGCEEVGTCFQSEFYFRRT